MKASKCASTTLLFVSFSDWAPEVTELQVGEANFSVLGEDV